MSNTAGTLVRGSTLRTLFYVAQVVVSFLIAPFIVHSLGDRLYGFWTLVITFIGYYGLLDLGLAHAVNRYISSAIGASDYKECNQIFNTAFLLFIFAGLAALFVSIVLSILAPYIFNDHNDTVLFTKIVLLLGLNMAIELPLRAFLGVLTSQLRFDLLSILQLTTLILRTVLIYIVLSLGHKVLALALVTVLASIPQKLFTVILAFNSFPQLKFGVRQFSWSTGRRLFEYSFYSFLWKIADILKFNVDVIVIGAFLHLSAVTHYRIGGMLALHMQSFMVAVLGFMLPVFSRLYGRKDSEGIKKTFFFVNKMSIYISCFIAFGLLFWGEPFIEIWMGAEYIDAYPVLFVLVIASIFAYFQVPAIEILLGTTQYKFVGIINVIEGLCNLALSLLLVKPFGLIGVALGTLIPTTIVKFFIQPIYVIRCLDVTITEYFKRIGKSIGVAVFGLIIPGVISLLYAEPNYTSLFTIGLISLSVYTLNIFTLGFSPEELDNIQNTLHIKLPIVRKSN